MSDIFVHIGLHKTGTTTLQKQFFAACDELNYIRRPALGPWVTELTTTDPIYLDASESRTTLAKHLRDDKPNLISREVLSGGFNSGLIKRGLDHRSPILDNLKAVAPDAKIILVLRRQDGLARSLYRQYLKIGGTESIERFYGPTAKSRPAVSMNLFRFMPYVQMIERNFPKGFLVLTFEEFVQDQASFLKKLSDFIGITAPAVGLRQMNRTTLGALGLEIARYSNYLFRSNLNPGGLIPGIPIYKRGRIKWNSPMSFIHGSWPWKGKLSKDAALFRVGENVLAHVKEDNRMLDEAYSLDLKKYGYY